MSATTLTGKKNYVIHPLDDDPELKLFRNDLGRMRMTPWVRTALWVLQAYIAGMALLLGWHLVSAL
jgi:hypothetical protein